MIVRSVTLCGALLSLLLLAPAAQAPLAGDEPQPREVGLVERAERGLVQLDVSVRGPAERIAELSGGDFEIAVGGRPIDDFIVDRVCGTGATRLPPAPVSAPLPPAPGDPSPPAPASATRDQYAFYFDQVHLTMGGRIRALELAHDLVDALIAGGNRGMVISNGRELRTFVELTSEAERLHAALDELEHDRSQWDPFATLEDNRIEDVHHAFRTSMNHALSVARVHQQEEIRRTAHALRRLETVLARFSELEPPKAVIYFSDTMRSNAGEHYLYLFPSNDSKGSVERDLRAPMALASWTADGPFQAVIDAAAAYGVRLYTVQAEGLVEKLSHNRPRSQAALSPQGGGPQARGGGGGGNVVGPGGKGGGGRGGGNAGGQKYLGGGGRQQRVGSKPRLSSRRVDDAQDSLVGFALETGGRAFLNGVGAPKIARRIREDLSCLHLISFDPGDLPRDVPLPVRVAVDTPGVTARSRGRLVVSSESARLSAKLLASFAAPEMGWSDVTLKAALVPTSFRDGRFTALLQIIVEGQPLAQSSWDLGGSLIYRGEVRAKIAGQISIDQPGRPVVLEGELSFPPGPFTIVAVGREMRTDQVATTRVRGDWPDPDEADVVIAPVALVQPATGAFVRADRVRRRGSLGRDERRPVPAGAPTALVSLICRRGSLDTALQADRRLVGASSAAFPSTRLDFGEDRCVQLRDVIPSDTMTRGVFRFEVSVLDGRRELDSADVEFYVEDAASTNAIR